MRSEPTNADKAVKVLQDGDGLRRVWIVERSDAVYVLRPEEWYRDVFEGEIVAEGWKPIYGNFGLFGSADLAESEAMASFDWLLSSPPPTA
ncbi:hypothetical protein E0H53_29220 [Rhizobium leguminosarum bv. viciae]|nr:hypothetical protein E0H53_29220 [Rhizobium leguminosarum bv. viciae]TBZ99580.1 hypothetical protein E0H63_25790 [Rhizobium leguminosarum bv. viciae]